MGHGNHQVGHVVVPHDLTRVRLSLLLREGDGLLDRGDRGAASVKGELLLHGLWLVGKHVVLNVVGRHNLPLLLRLWMRQRMQGQGRRGCGQGGQLGEDLGLLIRLLGHCVVR